MHVSASTYAYLGRRGDVDTSNLGARATEHMRRSGDLSRSWKGEGEKKGAEKDPDNPSKSNTASSSKGLDDSARSPPGRSNSLSVGGGTRHPLDPHEYQHAKRRLRKAVIEHYRCVENLVP